MLLMTRLHQLLLGGAIANTFLLLGCAKILGDYEVLATGGAGGAGESSATADATSSSVASSTTVGSGSGTPSGSGSGTPSGSTSGTSSSSTSGSTTSGGSTSSAGGDPCGAGSTAEIVDNFSDNLKGVEWSSYADGSGQVKVAETNQELHITTNGTLDLYGGYYWAKGLRSLIGCHLTLEVKQAAKSDAPILTSLDLVNDKDQASKSWLNISQDYGVILFRHFIANVEKGSQTIPYDPIAHRWWRFRESQGTTTFDTSPDGKTWKTRYSIPTPGFLTEVRVNILVGAVEASAVGGTAIFDNLNITPP
jgi:hypothetical protein